jgi:hypothetical protein
MVCRFFEILLATIVGGLFLVFATAAAREENLSKKIVSPLPEVTEQ